MNPIFNDLKLNLPKSNAHQRKTWAKKIVDNEINLIELNSLLKQDYEISSRYSWLLSDIGEYNKSYLKESLTSLFEIKNEISSIDIDDRFIKYWRIVDIPKHQEGYALNMLFEKLISIDSNASIKCYAMELLFQLSSKYADIKNELKLSIQDQLGKNTKSFDKKALKILNELQN